MGGVLQRELARPQIGAIQTGSNAEYQGFGSPQVGLSQESQGNYFTAAARRAERMMERQNTRNQGLGRPSIGAVQKRKTFSDYFMEAEARAVNYEQLRASQARRFAEDFEWEQLSKDILLIMSARA